MLLQTNSYIVPKDKRAEHARLLRRFRAALAKLGCDSFEVYEQVGANWNTGEPTGRYVQIMRFRDRRHQVAVQQAERNDPVAQAIIAEFCQLINFPYQQQQGLFAVGFYNSVLPVAPARPQPGDPAASPVPLVAEEEPTAEPEAAAADVEAAAAPEDFHADAEEAPPEAAEESAVEESPVPAEVATTEEPEPESQGDEVADLGSLLDAHLTRPLDEEGPDPEPHPLDAADSHPHHGGHGLDALDLADLELPAESEPRRAPDHAAR